MDLDFTKALAAAVPDHGFALAALLLALRLAALFLLTPLLYAFAMPTPVRVAIVIALAAALALGIPGEHTRRLAALGAGGLFAAAAIELALGAILALPVLVAFGAISFAGRVLDVQIGFGIGQVFDPVTQREVPILNSAFDKLGVVLFFLVDGPHALMRGIAYGLDRFPVGGAWSLQAAAPWILKQVAGLFVMGLSLAAPVVACVLLVELALGVVARNLPQMNMFVMAIPMKVVVGLAAVALWSGGIGHAMARVYSSIYSTWDGVFATAPAKVVR